MVVVDLDRLGHLPPLHQIDDLHVFAMLAGRVAGRFIQGHDHQLLLGALGIDVGHGHRLGGRLDLADLDAHLDVQALLGEGLQGFLGHLLVGGGQEFRHRFQDGDFRTQAAPHAAHFQTDDAGDQLADVTDVIGAAHDGQQVAHGGRLQRALADGEEIALAHQRDEIQAEAAGGGFHADAGVGHAAGDVGGDRHVGEFVGLVALHPRCRCAAAGGGRLRQRQCLARKAPRQGVAAPGPGLRAGPGLGGRAAGVLALRLPRRTSSPHPRVRTDGALRRGAGAGPAGRGREALAVQAAGHQAQQDGGGADPGLDGDAQPVGGVHHLGARVGDRRAAGFGHQADVGAAAHRLEPGADLGGVGLVAERVDGDFLLPPASSPNPWA